MLQPRGALRRHVCAWPCQSDWVVVALQGETWEEGFSQVWVAVWGPWARHVLTLPPRPWATLDGGSFRPEPQGAGGEEDNVRGLRWRSKWWRQRAQDWGTETEVRDGGERRRGRGRGHGQGTQSPRGCKVAGGPVLCALWLPRGMKLWPAPGLRRLQTGSGTQEPLCLWRAGQILLWHVERERLQKVV